VAAAVVLFIAGVLTWRMMSSLPSNGFPGRGESVIYFRPAQHRLHPLRAELLWAASGSCALVAIAAGAQARRRPSGSTPAEAAGSLS
jgi:hypothetical protein